MFTSKLFNSALLRREFDVGYTENKWDLLQHKTSGKTKNQMGGCGSEGRTTAARNKRNTRMEKKS